MDNNPPIQIIERRKNSTSCNQLNNTLEINNHRWELIIYPALFAFILLAAYGFYMVYSLATDVHFLAISVDSNMSIMSSNMTSMTDSVSKLSADVRVMGTHIESIDDKMTVLVKMEADIENIGIIMKQMDTSTRQMSRDLRSTTRPMSMFNSIIPW